MKCVCNLNQQKKDLDKSERKTVTSSMRVCVHLLLDVKVIKTNVTKREREREKQAFPSRSFFVDAVIPVVFLFSSVLVQGTAIIFFDIISY